MRPTVTAVIPAYNASGTVGAAIESVLAQTGAPSEVIVVDDGSSDGTADVAEAYGAPVRVLRQGHVGLPGACRNAGIRAAQGEYIAFLDADDEWLPGKLALQCALLNREPAVALTCSNAMRHVVSRPEADAPYFPLSQDYRYCGLAALIRDNFVITSTVAVRRAAFLTAGPFHERVEGAEDYDLWLRIARDYPIVYLPEVLAVYRDHASSYRSTIGAVRLMTNISSSIKELRDSLGPDRENERAAARERIATLSLAALGLMHDPHDWRLASLHAGRLLRERPLSLGAWRAICRCIARTHGRRVRLHRSRWL